jgi:hypothetical protein
MTPSLSEAESALLEYAPATEHACEYARDGRWVPRVAELHCSHLRQTRGTHMDPADLAAWARGIKRAHDSDSTPYINIGYLPVDSAVMLAVSAVRWAAHRLQIVSMNKAAGDGRAKGAVCLLAHVCYDEVVLIAAHLETCRRALPDLAQTGDEHVAQCSAYWNRFIVLSSIVTFTAATATPVQMELAEQLKTLLLFLASARSSDLYFLVDNDAHHPYLTIAPT